MTHEWHPADEAGEKKDGREMEHTLEQRLRSYYGPAQPEQPLPAASWLQVRSQLGVQQPRSSQRRQRHVWRPFRLRLRRRRFSFPANVQEAFTRILYAAHRSPATHMLACRSTPRTRVPRVRVVLLSKQHLQLTLPAHMAIKPAELDVLLAGGLARYEELRRPTAVLARVLSICAILGLLVWAMIALFSQELSLLTRFLNMFACIVLIGTILWLLHVYIRRLAQKADMVMVRWVGRTRACQGLHALADRSRVPSQRRWGELSFTERIAHVCGTPVAMEEERFTLIR